MGTELLLSAVDPTAAAEAAAAANLPLILGLTVFVLAIFVGFEIITKIPPTLHTPLMSGSNAISGITVVGALLMAGRLHDTWPFLAASLGFFAVILATVNVVGGFLVTNRMLEMFRRKK
ncbi:MAG: NAD(P) transhydrogenase subunit alpha [Pirellulales bacterium]|nr:NAD(P) transhydrogenase subunit alpha [Pirellulales bacterium]